MRGLIDYVPYYYYFSIAKAFWHECKFVVFWKESLNMIIILIFVLLFIIGLVCIKKLKGNPSNVVFMLTQDPSNDKKQSPQND